MFQFGGIPNFIGQMFPFFNMGSGFSMGFSMPMFTMPMIQMPAINGSLFSGGQNFTSQGAFNTSALTSTPIFNYTPSPSMMYPVMPTFTPITYSSSPSSTAASASSQTMTEGYSSSTLTSIRDSKLMKNVPADRKNKILAAVDEACKKYNLDPKLVISIMYCESGFNPNAKSKCGACGLMQLLPSTAKQYGATNIYDINQNINAAVKFLKVLKDKYNGNIELMAAAYNAGPGRVKDSIPNIKETKTYVKRVVSTYNSIA